MAKFGGFPKEFTNLGYGKLKKWFDSRGIQTKCPDVNFDNEAKLIGLEPSKKKIKEE